MFIQTNSSNDIPKDTFDSDGNLTNAEYWHCHIEDDIYFVEDSSDLSGVTYTEVSSNAQYTSLLEKRVKEYLGATDWYVTRKYDIGTDIPTSVNNLRTRLRNLI